VSSSEASIAVIGGGYAGMAAAVELTRGGRRVTVFEASRTLGGRARAVDLDGQRVDNGQHILLGAYRETLRLMRCVGADPARLLRRLPLRLEFPGELRLLAPCLPAPWHGLAAVLLARGFDWREKNALLRLLHGLRRAQFAIVPDVTVAEWLNHHTAPSRQRRLFWEPLCLAALNTPASRASMQVFAHVLRDGMLAQRAASDLLLPCVDLSALFPEPAARFVVAHGGSVHRGRRITTIEHGALEHTANDWRVNGEGPFAQVVLAVAPYHLAALSPAFASTVAQFDWEPILTAYLTYPPHVRLAQPMLGVADGAAQWLFDRGQLGGPAGLIAAVVSAYRANEDANELRSTLTSRIHQDIARLVPHLPAPLASQVIVEKRATFACTPGLVRPSLHGGAPGLWLAGDYVAADPDATDYPATIEGAVRSGMRAAHAALRVR
jgi:squalene-associated FAD-dependent desaturase